MGNDLSCNHFCEQPDMFRNRKPNSIVSIHKTQRPFTPNLEPSCTAQYVRSKGFARFTSLSLIIPFPDRQPNFQSFNMAPTSQRWNPTSTMQAEGPHHSHIMR